MAKKKKVIKKTIKKSTKKPVKKSLGKKKTVSEAVRWAKIKEKLSYTIHPQNCGLIELHKLKPHPQNPNNHPDKQIALFAEIMKGAGVRRRVVISNQSGFMTVGHGQVEAMRLNGWEWVPIEYQDYASPAQEYAAMVADNTLAALSRIDKSKVAADIVEINKAGPPVIVEMLGIPDFNLVEDKSKKEAPIKHGPKGDLQKLEFKGTIDGANIIREALHRASTTADHDEESGQDERFSQLVYICKDFLGR